MNPKYYELIALLFIMGVPLGAMTWFAVIEPWLQQRAHRRWLDEMEKKRKP